MKPGSYVEVKTKDGAILQGLVMNSPDKNILTLKLSSGYNVGLDKKNISKIKELKKEIKVIPKVETKVKFNPNLKTISILHTGGTIASKVDYETGGVVTGFSSEDLVNMFPEILNIANIKSSNVLNLMSEDVRFTHYQILAKAIEKEIKNGINGIIIGHGTDTLALTATALSFIFENLPIPILLVGAQRSSDRGSTDAKLNLLSAAYFITNSDFKGVGICMHENSSDNFCAIFPATKTKKLHTSRRDAFKAVNDTIIARVDYEKKKIDFLKPYTKEVSGKLIIKNKFEEKVAVLRVYPNMNADLINTLTSKKYKGFVLESSGIGQAPINIEENLGNYKALKKFIDSGGFVVLTSNCIFGAVHADIYKNGRRLKEIGIIFCEDMLTETAFIKLSWLIGNFSKKEVARLVTDNLRGEISKRLIYEEDFLKFR